MFYLYFCIYLRILVSSTISMSDDVRVAFNNTHVSLWSNRKIEIIFFLSLTFVHKSPSLSISRSRSRYEADLDVSEVSFIQSSMRHLRSTKLLSCEIFCEKEIIYIAECEIKGSG